MSTPEKCVDTARSVNWPSTARLLLPSAAMLILYQVSSQATRAVCLAGLFAVTLSHNVLKFKEAKVSNELFEFLPRDPCQLQ